MRRAGAKPHPRGAHGGDDSGHALDTCADALVFDYVGFPCAFLDEVAAEIDLPVFDLGMGHRRPRKDPGDPVRPDR